MIAPSMTIKKVLSSLLLIAMLQMSSATYGGKFDCSVVYDEFDQLMMGEFLVEPDRYVPVQPSLISRRDFLLYQNNLFKLREDRKDAGVAVFNTNHNLSGKMVFYWQERPAEERIPVQIDEVIIFGRVADGYAPVRYGPIYLTVNFAVDLDTGTVVENDDPAADLAYYFEDGDYILQEVIPAQINFPIGSMCAAVD